MNNLVHSIKFTSEIEENRCLPFLDVMLHREDFSVKYSIYRKPTNNLSYVHFYSGHDIKVKKAVFISMFLRALRIVSSEFFDFEINKITNIGKNLCYPSWFLDNCLCTAKRIFHKPRIISNTNKFKNCLVLPFFNGCSSIIKHLKSLDISVVFRYDSTLKKLLIRNSPQSDCNIVYRIPCKDCDKYYLGQTSKSLDTRINQHKYNVRKASSNSALFLHYSSCNHHIDWSNSSVVIRSNNIVTRNLLESALISLTKEKNFNLSGGLFPLDPILLNMFSANLKNILLDIT